MVSILKYLRSEGGYISAAMALGSMIMNGVMGSKKAKQAAKLAHQTGEEKNLSGYTTDLFQRGIPNETAMREEGRTGFINPAMEAAKSGGLMPAISEAFSQRPNSAEYDAIARQEQNLKNQALNTGARGGLLRQQMFEAGKNAATNKLNVMENARQNALQRAFQVFAPTAPSQASDINRSNQVLGWNQLASGNLTNLAKLGVERNLAQLGNVSKDAGGMGSGLGSVMGGLGSILGMFGGGGSITNAVGGSPTFSLPMGSGEGFSPVPFMPGYGG